MKTNILIFLLAAGVFASCNSNSTSTSSNNNNNNGGTPANTMYITTGGKIDTLGASGMTVTNSGSTTTTITGANTFGTSCTLTLQNISAPGTYTVVSGGISVPSNKVGIVFINPNASRYTSTAGSMTITSISSTAIQATFNATFLLQAGNDANRDTITNGAVNSTIQ